MFIKINKLYNFLIRSGYQGYANTLEKIALEESDFKDKYPNIYLAWKNSQRPPLSAYLAQISRAEAKGIDLNKENINSFQDIIQILKGEKQKDKSSKSEEVLNILKKEGVSNIAEEDIELAFGVGLNSEEIIYLAKDKCNHTWEEKLHYADRFKKERLALFDKDTEITDFKDIDEVRDEYFAKKNTAPLDLQEFYEEIKDKALNDSEVIYNSNNYIVSHSKSEKAAQYWEQSCVTVDGRGVVSSGLCSAHPHGSLFNSYDDKIHSFQIITKEYKTLKQTPRTSFTSKNKGYNLITLSIYRNSGDVAWGGQDTVNRYNEEVLPGDLFYALADEYEKVCSKILEYCKNNLSLDVKNLKITEGEAKESLTIEAFVAMNLKEYKGVDFPHHKLKYLNDVYFISNYIEFPIEVSKEEIYKRAERLYPQDFLKHSEYIPNDIFDKLLVEKLSKLKSIYFFKYRNKIPKKIFQKFELEKAESLHPLDFFEISSKISKRVLDSVAEDKASVLDGENFFRLEEKMPKDVFKKFKEEKFIELYKEGDVSDEDFLKRKYDISDSIFQKYIYSVIRFISPDSFFELSKLIPRELRSEFAEVKASNVTPDKFFKEKQNIPNDLYGLCEDAVIERSDVKTILDNRSSFSQDKFDSIIKEKFSAIDDFKLKPSFLYSYRDVINKELYNSLMEKFSKRVRNFRLLLPELKFIPKEIYEESGELGMKRMHPKIFFDSKDLIPEYLFLKYEEEKMRKMRIGALERLNLENESLFSKDVYEKVIREKYEE